MRILTIADDPVVRQLLRTGLARAGHEALEMRDRRCAWELLQREPIRFVILDWGVHDTDGAELIRRIRSADSAGYTYIMLLTEKGATEDGANGLGAGADDHLPKPCDADELAARVAIGERILDLETRLREARGQMLLLAFHDSLTGLLNRRAIYEHAVAELNRAKREGEPMSLVLLDIDHLKAVNEQHGHLIGDEALCLVADTIIEHIRPYDWAGRWGGEEFLLVLPGTEQQEAAAVAERVRARIAAAALPLPDGGSLSLQVSLGVTSVSPDAPLPLDTLLQQVDEALYYAKRAGRNRVCVFTNEQLLIESSFL